MKYLYYEKNILIEVIWYKEIQYIILIIYTLYIILISL